MNGIFTNSLTQVLDEVILETWDGPLKLWTIPVQLFQSCPMPRHCTTCPPISFPASFFFGYLNGGKEVYSQDENLTHHDWLWSNYVPESIDCFMNKLNIFFLDYLSYLGSVVSCHCTAKAMIFSHLHKPTAIPHHHAHSLSWIFPN